MRSIVGSLQKRIISLIPFPLLLSKSIESSDYATGANAYLDIGYTHTTVLFEKDGEILHFETFSFGTKMLLDLFVSVFPESPYMEIESILSSNVIPTDKKDIYEAIYTQFEEYVFDVFFSVLSSDRSI